MSTTTRRISLLSTLALALSAQAAPLAGQERIPDPPRRTASTRTRSGSATWCS